MEEVSAIKVEHVYKDFLLPKDKVSSIKGILISITKGSPWRIKETQHALKDINIDVKKGEFFGIVGRNGSGKSTLLKILAGIYQPNKGRVEIKGKLVPFIELGVGFNPELSGRDNIYLNGALFGFTRTEIDNMYDAIVEFAELKDFMDQKLKNYSSGMQVRLAFSLAIRAESDILLIDEVLAVGDADFQRKCYAYFKKLKKDKKTVVFVSHDMAAVREYCDRAVLIEDSQIISEGKTDKVTAKYSQLFLGDDIIETDNKKTDSEKRWGNNHMRINKATAQLYENDLVVNVDAKVNKSIDRVLYGIHIMAPDGTEITAMNNRMIQEPDLVDLNPGTNIEFNWRLQNIFNDGKYFITLTLVDEGGTTFDWYNDAASFVVKRPQRSTTSVIPPVHVSYKLQKEN